jgi:flavin reductase (DIM6/NTAB) family NADH-FMN oxidoreductase RutF
VCHPADGLANSARNPYGSEKHTLKHIRQSGEFCINVLTQPVWMVHTANAIHEEDSEFIKAGLTPIPSLRVKPPRVKEVPIHFECKLHQLIELGPNRHPLVMGEVVLFHVDPAGVTNGYIDMRKLLGRLNGFFCATLGESSSVSSVMASQITRHSLRAPSH